MHKYFHMSGLKLVCRENHTATPIGIIHELLTGGRREAALAEHIGISEEAVNAAIGWMLTQMTEAERANVGGIHDHVDKVSLMLTVLGTRPAR